MIEDIKQNSFFFFHKKCLLFRNSLSIIIKTMVEHLIAQI